MTNRNQQATQRPTQDCAYTVNFAKMLNTLFLLSVVFSLTACSVNRAPIDQVEVTQQGKTNSDRLGMHAVCKGFYMDSSTFLDFYQHAQVVETQTLNTHYQKLPCFSSGTVYLENQKYNWIIRAGGVGEFYNENNRFTKVCGIKCCDKVKGVC